MIPTITITIDITAENNFAFAIDELLVTTVINTLRKLDELFGSGDSLYLDIGILYRFEFGLDTAGNIQTAGRSAKDVGLVLDIGIHVERKSLREFAFRNDSVNINLFADRNLDTLAALLRNERHRIDSRNQRKGRVSVIDIVFTCQRASVVRANANFLQSYNLTLEIVEHRNLDKTADIVERNIRIERVADHGESLAVELVFEQTLLVVETETTAGSVEVARIEDGVRISDRFQIERSGRFACISISESRRKNAVNDNLVAGSPSDCRLGDGDVQR